MVEGQLHLDMNTGQMLVYYKGMWVSLGPLPELETFFEKMEWSPIC
jgi:hypothetical protein